MIDIHQHVVYGIDDGPKTADESLRMLRMAAEHGTTGIIATSHAYPAMQAFSQERYYCHLEKLRQLCKEQKIEIELYEGCEIFYSDIALRQLEAGSIPSLAGSRYVLVEFEPAVELDRLCDAVRRLANRGYRPIVAHCERYWALHKELRLIEEMKRHFYAGFQMNASMFSKKLPGRIRRFRDKMLELELVDYIASDGHNCQLRPPVLDAAYDWISEEFDEEYAQALLCDHQMRLLHGIKR